MTALQPRPSPLAGTAAGLGVDGVPLRSITGTHPVPFRSPLLRESRLMLLPRGTEMFQFPRCPPVTLCIRGAGHDARTSRGCPIRIRTALRSLAAPRPRFAALRVLLRPLTPRHPPRTPLRLACAHIHAYSRTRSRSPSFDWFVGTALLAVSGQMVPLLLLASAKLKQTCHVVVKVQSSRMA